MKNIAIWVGVALVIVLLMVGLAYMGNKQANPEPLVLSMPIGPEDMANGAQGAKAVLVEYGDFQCPACAQYFVILEQVMKDYGYRAQFVFRHFPLRSIHSNAQLASQAAQSAGEQGKFWEYYRLLYANQASWSSLSDPTDTFKGYAGDLQLDIEKFSLDLKSDLIVARVQRDVDSGNTSKVNSTPTFFLNGKQVSGAPTAEGFKQMIDEALK